VKDFTSLKFVIDAISDVREAESWIENDFLSVFQRYEVLEKYLPPECMTKMEMDNKAILRVSWQRLLDKVEEVRDTVHQLQQPFEQSLLQNVEVFKKDVSDFKQEYDVEGPMVVGLNPIDAMTRLSKFDRKFDTLQRKYELYSSGEKLFGLPQTNYPVIHEIKGQLESLKCLYGVYQDVLTTMDEYK
ncbi:dynein, axonemal, heavy chain 5-like protein, partial [Reticulomyxa filosa]